MQRHFLSKKVTKKINSMFPSANISRSTKVEYIKDDDLELVLINKRPSFFYVDKKLFPALRFVHGRENDFRKITVDMGAVKFVCSGADVMRPGITRIDENISKGDTVIVVDEKNGKALCVGMALVGSDEMNNMKQGRAVKSVHWVGDKVWNYIID
ncbi:MAG: RNA-binding protein [Patescibacteria group bacterium]|nr:RNA-binding protein [Patescibacteria group bacterium]